MNKVTIPVVNPNHPVNFFMRAIANELHRDLYSFRQSRVFSYTKVVIPRFEQLSRYGKSHPRALAFLSYVSCKLWIPILYPILLIFQTITVVINRLRRHRIKCVLNKQEIFFANSITSLICSNLNQYQGKYLYSSRDIERKGPSGRSLGCIEDYAGWFDIAAAFLNSVRSTRQIKRSFDTPGAVFQIYPAFKWFLCWEILCKIMARQSEIWISSDCDRWAVLVDQLPVEAKKIIVQHGLLHDPCGHNGSRSDLPLPTRLNNIDQIVVIDTESEFWYRNLVLANDHHTSFVRQVQWLPQQDGAQNKNVSALSSTLIIGQKEHLIEECELANRLLASNPHARVYLKPHPSVSFKIYKKFLDKDIKFIDDPYFFPAVELCISFGRSTLAHLYQEQGVKIIYPNECVKYSNSTCVSHTSGS